MIQEKVAQLYTSRQPLVLASASPRRRDYLAALGLEFARESVAICEQPESGESPVDFVQRMALEKAVAVAGKYPGYWLLAGDTVVCLDGRILGKPADGKEAVAMLLALAGREHLVHSAFSLCCPAKGVQIVRLATTRVVFAPFPEALARAYVATGEPLDKAGAYAIQGLAAALVTRIDGSYSNVVGLPLAELVAVLLEQGVITVAGG